MLEQYNEKVPEVQPGLQPEVSLPLQVSLQNSSYATLYFYPKNQVMVAQGPLTLIKKKKIEKYNFSCATYTMGVSQDIVTWAWIATFRPLYCLSSSGDDVDWLHLIISSTVAVSRVFFACCSLRRCPILRAFPHYLNAWNRLMIGGFRSSLF